MDLFLRGAQKKWPSPLRQENSLMLQRERKGLEEFLFVEDKHNLLPQLKWAVLICPPWTMSHPRERGANPEFN